MKITLIDASQASEILIATLGGRLDSYGTAIEQIRHEASSRAGCPRHLLIDRVARFVSPATILAPELVDAAFEDLERQGDVTVADGGFVYPTPVRIIDLGGGVYRFVCSLPSAGLQTAVDGDWTVTRARRDCKVRHPIAGIARALGGVVLSAEAWSSFERIPAANREWIELLEARLAWRPVSPGGLERDEPLEWKTCIVDETGPHWRAVEEGRLWRARNRWRRWVFAWSVGTSPALGSFIELSSDEGARTVFALAQVSGHPAKGTMAKVDRGVAITVPLWMPNAEYRFLSTCAEQLNVTPPGSGWLLPGERVERALTMLKQRLGMQIDELSQA